MSWTPPSAITATTSARAPRNQPWLVDQPTAEANRAGRMTNAQRRQIRRDGLVGSVVLGLCGAGTVAVLVAAFALGWVLISAAVIWGPVALVCAPVPFTRAMWETRSSARCASVTGMLAVRVGPGGRRADRSRSVIVGPRVLTLAGSPAGLVEGAAYTAHFLPGRGHLLSLVAC